MDLHGIRMDQAPPSRFSISPEGEEHACCLALSLELHFDGSGTSNEALQGFLREAVERLGKQRVVWFSKSPGAQWSNCSQDSVDSLAQRMAPEGASGPCARRRLSSALESPEMMIDLHLAPRDFLGTRLASTLRVLVPPTGDQEIMELSLIHI